jgi:hypothetical protein
MRTRPVVDRLESEFGGRVQFMRYNIDDPASDAAKRAYKFRAQPQIVIADAAGHIVFSRLSELTHTRLKADLEQVLNERD